MAEEAEVAARLREAAGRLAAALDAALFFRAAAYAAMAADAVEGEAGAVIFLHMPLSYKWAATG